MIETTKRRILDHGALQMKASIANKDDLVAKGEGLREDLRKKNAFV